MAQPRESRPLAALGMTRLAYIRLDIYMFPRI
jgi:hypothetical protein